MGALADLRATLVDALEGQIVIDGYALPVVDTIPETFTPPAMWVRPAEPYVDLTGQPGGRAVIGYEIFAVYRAGTNPLISAGVENLTEQLLDALGRTTSWLVTQIGAPVDLATAAGTFPAVRCVTTHSATITTD